MTDNRRATSTAILDKFALDLTQWMAQFAVCLLLLLASVDANAHGHWAASLSRPTTS